MEELSEEIIEKALNGETVTLLNGEKIFFDKWTDYDEHDDLIVGVYDSDGQSLELSERFYHDQEEERDKWIIETLKALWEED